MVAVVVVKRRRSTDARHVLRQRPKEAHDEARLEFTGPRGRRSSIGVRAVGRMDVCRGQRRIVGIAGVVAELDGRMDVLRLLDALVGEQLILKGRRENQRTFLDHRTD